MPVLQDVSGFYGELLSEPAHHGCPGSPDGERLPWWHVFSLLMMPVFGSLGSEWPLQWPAFGPAHDTCPRLLQRVSGFRGELHLEPAHDTYPRLSSK